jgi:hypothetical protein
LVLVAVPVSLLVSRAQKAGELLASAQSQVPPEPPRVVRREPALQILHQQVALTVLRVPHSVREPLAQLVSAPQVPQPEPALPERPVLELELVVLAALRVQLQVRALQQRVLPQPESVSEQASAQTGVQLSPRHRARHVRRWLPLLPQLLRQQRPSDDAGLFLPHLRGSSSNAFSFRLRHNPAAGQ